MTEKPSGYDTKWLLDKWENNPDIPKDNGRSVAFTTVPQDPLSKVFEARAILQDKGRVEEDHKKKSKAEDGSKNKTKLEEASTTKAKSAGAPKKGESSSANTKAAIPDSEFVACDEDKEVVRLLRLTQSRLIVIGAMIADIQNSGLFFHNEDDEKFDPADKAFMDALASMEKQVAENFPRLRKKWAKFETLHDRYAEHYGRQKLDEFIWEDAKLLEKKVAEVAKNSIDWNYDE